MSEVFNQEAADAAQEQQKSSRFVDRGKNGLDRVNLDFEVARAMGFVSQHTGGVERLNDRFYVQLPRTNEC